MKAKRRTPVVYQLTVPYWDDSEDAMWVHLWEAMPRLDDYGVPARLPDACFVMTFDTSRDFQRSIAQWHRERRFNAS